ncbi:MAG: hypothetical protein HY430_02590 [Candidatus Levybacteria bacterium]|nr:hypothetical protein [Candidatus Levybacteria bacterium]
MAQKNYKPHYEHLKNKWTEQHLELQHSLWKRHRKSLRWFANRSKHLTASALSGLLLLASPISASISAPITTADQKPEFTDLDKDTFLVSDLYTVLPKEVRPLQQEEEQRVISLLSARFGIPVKSEIDGKRLERNYGLIGAEQHLMRYPGDTIYSHFESEEDARIHTSSGMAPGRGAWGYFASSREVMTEEDIQRERYYIAVQTFLAPEFNSKVAEYRDFFKYRKMLLVNPYTGKSIVTVIGDAGPAVWTGKRLGGSPEVMQYLGRVDGSLKGPVLFFFIDDPENKVPLGPMHVL